ncbi:MAG TPA: HAMP domain-containing sensor histidine kinase, partial [bacterium]|nr:HAMP domain-containing sensor histidine kinase [bacterium]
NRDPAAPPVLAKDWTFIPVSPANGRLDYGRTLRTEDLIHATPETKISGHWHNKQEDQLVDFRLINIDGEKWLIGIHQFENAVQEQLKEIVPFVVAVGSFLFLAIVIPFGMFTARLMHTHEHERDMYIRRIETHTREIEKFAGQLKETNDNLHYLQQQKNSLYARLSHDLRAPLNSILSASSLIAEGIYGDITPKQARATEIIHRNVQVLLHLIDGILQLSRVESGQVALEPETFELDPLLRNLVENLQPLAESKNLKLLYQSNPALPRLHTDRDKLYLILQNLISNAIKYTHQGYVEMSAGPRDGPSLAIAVRDTGPGISSEDQERIFHEFTRGPNSNSGPKGVGLGLTITKELTQLLGGQITVHSLPGEGATFTLILPAGVMEPSSAAAPMAK